MNVLSNAASESSKSHFLIDSSKAESRGEARHIEDLALSCEVMISEEVAAFA